ncbi:MAG: type I DNA topoisomerase, partial [Leptonema sp. (in: Bacteria)]|nr:type I DNA topoisomerase [Leptonema sp. (in: bacteria)]
MPEAETGSSVKHSTKKSVKKASKKTSKSLSKESTKKLSKKSTQKLTKDVSTAFSKKTTKKSSKRSATVYKNKTLVIVESPAKAKTINKYLGNNYHIEASMGHVIDLPKSRLAVDTQNNFTPEYITVRGRAPILNRLKRAAESAKEVLLAADPDREGEAISYHLARAISSKNPNIKRIEFNEITKQAVIDAVNNPREIDQALVNAQQARRILDRLVGYNVSPILWKKIKRGLSAGRVQSVALRLICEREDEIDAFVPEEYWTLDAKFKKDKSSFVAALALIDGKKIDLKNQESMDSVLTELEKTKDQCLVEQVKISERRRQPTAPYTTSRMQQDASNKLSFTSQKTMMVAQQLYEGIDIKGTPIGLITYMRTDSTRISPD